MRKIILPSLLAAFVSAYPAQAAVVLDGFTLDTGGFGSGTGVHSTGTQPASNSLSAFVNQDGSGVVFSSSSDISIMGSGQATIDGNPLIADLTVLFEQAWDNVTFNFQRGDTDATFAVIVNGVTDFGTCSICTVTQGNNRFQISGSGITSLAFAFDQSISAARQFRVDGPSQAPIPEPASWAMMIAGLGLAGGAMRRRPKKVQFA